MSKSRTSGKLALLAVTLICIGVMDSARAENTLTLEEAITKGVRQNPNLEISNLEIERAIEKQKMAEAVRWPKLNLNMSATQYDNDSLVHPIRDPGVFPPLDDVIYDYGLAVKLPLYTGGKLAHGVALSEYGKQIAKDRRRQNQQDLIYNITSVYFKIQHLASLVRTYDLRIKSLSEQERHVKLMRKTGKASRLDELKIKGLLTKARHDRVQIKNHYQEAWSLLYEMMGQEKTFKSNQTQLVNYVLPLKTNDLSLEEFLGEAERYRPELSIARHQIDADKSRVAIANADRSPEVSLTAAYRESSGSELDFYDDWNIGVELSVPIFDGGERRSHIAEARIARKQSVSNLEKTRLSVNKQVQDAWHRYIEAKSRIEVTKTSVTEARETLSIEKLRYDQGVSVITDLLDAESNLLSAQADRLQSEFDMIAARIGLLFSSGTLSQDRVTELVIPEAGREQEVAE